MLAGRFETGTNGTYAWLNDVVAVGVLTRNGTDSVKIDMWQVSPCFVLRCVGRKERRRKVRGLWGLRLTGLLGFDGFVASQFAEPIFHIQPTSQP